MDAPDPPYVPVAPGDTIADPPESAVFECWALEGSMPDDSIVRLSVWTSPSRPPAFHAAVKAALYEALKALYPHCPRPRHDRDN
jgi:hypothetical protein